MCFISGSTLHIYSLVYLLVESDVADDGSGCAQQLHLGVDDGHIFSLAGWH